MRHSYIKSLLTVLPVITAGLYMIGATYHQSYLEAFGIDDSMFLLSIDRLLLYGFFALVSFSIQPYIYGLVLILVLVSLVEIFAELAASKSIQTRYLCLTNYLKKRFNKKPPTPMVQAIFSKLNLILTRCLHSMYIFIFLIVTIFLSQNIGRSQAQDEMNEFTANKSAFVQLTTNQLPAETRAKQIICSTTHCAYWLGNGAIVLKHEQITKIVTHRPFSKNKTSN